MRIDTITREHAKWLKKPIQAKGYRHWLTDNTSLTLRLKQRHAKFSVNPMRMHNGKALSDECDLLRLKPYQHALVREVILVSNQHPVVFAHSILPKRSLRGAWNQFGRLGNKPLGEALFANPKVGRTSFRFRKLPSAHPLFQSAALHIDGQSGEVWARRSVFSLGCAQILVTEVFLAAILESEYEQLL